jgi:DNA-directed RNA polymerase subunit N (RpoN/RPB10)
MRNMGLCVIDMKDEKPIKLKHAGLRTPSTLFADQPWPRRAIVSAQRCTDWLKQSNLLHSDFCTKVVIELQENFRGHKGEAAKDSEAIQKLYFFTGALITDLINTGLTMGIYGVFPGQWKGQLPKAIGVKRANSWCAINNWPVGHTNHNITDAIGIAKYSVKRIIVSHRHIQFADPIQTIG